MSIYALVGRTLPSWDIDNAVFVTAQVLSVSAQDSGPEAVVLSADGTKVYIMGYTNSTVYQYTLSTPWDLSSGSYAGKSKLVSAQDTFCYDLAFSTDGTKMYVGGRQNSAIFQYTLSTPWDVSTATYASKSCGASYVNAIRFSPDGTKLFFSTIYTLLYQYTLSPPWDISTATYSGKFLNTVAQVAPFRGIVGAAFSADGMKVYVQIELAEGAFQFSLSAPFDLAVWSYAGKHLDTTGQDAVPEGMCTDPYGHYYYMVGRNTPKIYRYNMP